jgi:hypothetical protein
VGVLPALKSPREAQGQLGLIKSFLPNCPFGLPESLFLRRLVPGESCPHREICRSLSIPVSFHVSPSFSLRGLLPSFGRFRRVDVLRYPLPAKKIKKGLDKYIPFYYIYQ